MTSLCILCFYIYRYHFVITLLLSNTILDGSLDFFLLKETKVHTTIIALLHKVRMVVKVVML